MKTENGSLNSPTLLPRARQGLEQRSRDRTTSSRFPNCRIECTSFPSKRVGSPLSSRDHSQPGCCDHSEPVGHPCVIKFLWELHAVL